MAKFQGKIAPILPQKQAKNFSVLKPASVQKPIFIIHRARSPGQGLERKNRRRYRSGWHSLRRLVFPIII
nr:MAG TPA_asm: hypothetical protein [Caudoviricetes sp.]